MGRLKRISAIYLPCTAARSKTGGMKLLITVPHARCPPNVPPDSHPCDFAAERMAKLIHQRVPNSKLLLGDVPRTALDLNRSAARESAYRETLRGLVHEGVTVLDVHSYPRGAFRTNTETVLLSNPANRAESASLAEAIQGRGVSTALLRGARNDIQQEMTELGIPALLLEVREDGAAPLPLVAKAVSDWVSQSNGVKAVEGEGVTLGKLAEQGASVVTGFFSTFIFDLLRARYRDELGFLVVMASAVLWVKAQRVTTMFLMFLHAERDDPRWLKVWRRIISLVGLLLVFLFGQYVIVLVVKDIEENQTSHALSIFFLLVILWGIYSYVEDSSGQFSRDPLEDTDSSLVDAATTASITSSRLFL